MNAIMHECMNEFKDEAQCLLCVLCVIKSPENELIITQL